MVEMIKTFCAWALVMSVPMMLIVGGWMLDALVKVKLAQWMGIL